MPDIANPVWSEIDDRNSEAAPNGFPPGLPAYIDQIGQMLMGAVKRSWARANPVYETTGTGDAYQVSPDSAPNKINMYEIVRARIDRTNTTATPTFQFGRTNPRVVAKITAAGSTALEPGDLVAGKGHGFWYDGTNWIVIDPGTLDISAVVNGMSKAVYDPTAKAADAFDMGNMDEAADAKIMTAAERVLIAGALQSANNLSDVADAGAALENLGGASKAYVDGKIGDGLQASTLAEVAASTLVAAPAYIRTTGYASVGDFGGALYKKVASEPTHAGKFSITLADGETVVWYAFADNIVNPIMLGAKFDGVTDDTTANQNAIGVAIAAKVPLCIPISYSGGTRITASLTMDTPIKIFGVSRFLSTIAPDAGVTAFSVFSGNGPTFEDFGIQYPAGSNSGNIGILVGSEAINVSSPIFKNLRIKNASTGIDIRASYFYTIEAVHIYDVYQTGVKVQNLVDGDSGDGTITECVISNTVPTTTVTGILWKSGGGIRIVNNKIVGIQYGIGFQLSDGVSTADVFVIGNSIEGYKSSPASSFGIYFNRDGTGSLTQVQIAENQIGGFVGGHIYVGYAGSKWLYDFKVTENGGYSIVDGTHAVYTISAASGFAVALNGGIASLANTVFIKTTDDTANGVIGPNPKTAVGSGSWASNSIYASGATVIAPN